MQIFRDLYKIYALVLSTQAVASITYQLTITKRIRTLSDLNEQTLKNPSDIDACFF